MKDAVGQPVKVGDIVAFGTPNKYTISVRVVTDIRGKEGEFQELFVRGASKVYRAYDNEKREWYDVEPYWEMQRGGWTFPERVVVVNKLENKELVDFLKENVK